MQHYFGSQTACEVVNLATIAIVVIVVAAVVVVA